MNSIELGFVNFSREKLPFMEAYNPFIKDYVVEISPSGQNNWSEIFRGEGDSTRLAGNNDLPTRIVISKPSFNPSDSNNKLTSNYIPWGTDQTQQVDLRVYTVNHNTNSTPNYLYYYNISLNTDIGPPDIPIIDQIDDGKETLQINISKPDNLGDDLNPDNSNLDISYQIDVNPVGTFGKTDGAGVH